ncbi:MAG: toxin TcdB middle/N-terminal domain-containing protein, partial [Flavitalea sp.]
MSEQGDGWFYKDNLGNGNFSPARLISSRPSFSGLDDGKLSILELQGDGRKYLVQASSLPKGYFELTMEEEWTPFHAFDSYPNIDLHDPNLKFIDLNGDGLPELLISYEKEFLWYASKGIAGYDSPLIAAKAIDEEKGPQVIFEDTDNSALIAIADMSGDGLADIVVISYSSVCYYPNLGYGKFGARVSMPMNGCFDTITGFNPHFIQLADIDGSGTTDIIYCAKEKLQVWFNEAGNSLADKQEIFYPFPLMDDAAKISFTDLLGNGTACIIWSSPLPAFQNSPLKYIDLMGGRKPHVMFSHKNNMGRETTLDYKSSTQYYLQDKKEGKPWITKLPFPVQCVSRVMVEDKISQTRFVNEYSYHHGYFDAPEREFRGFAKVIQKDSESFENFIAQKTGSVTQVVEKDFFQPVVTTIHWFHTGAYLGRETMEQRLSNEFYPASLVKSGKITDAKLITELNSYQLPEITIPGNLTAAETVECYRALKGLPLRTEVYSDEGDPGVNQHPYIVTQYNYSVQLLQAKKGNQYAVFLTHEKENLGIHFERNPNDPRITHAINIAIDTFGNILESAAIVYGRKEADMDLPTKADRTHQTRQHILYTKNIYTKLIDTPGSYCLPVACENQVWELNAALTTAIFYTKEEIQISLAAAIITNYAKEAKLGEKRMIEHSKTLFLKTDLTGPETFGTMAIPLLTYENYLLAFTPSMIADIYGVRTNEVFLRTKGAYIDLDGDNNYWIPSGRIAYHADFKSNPFATVIPPVVAGSLFFAKKNFYLPLAYSDGFGNMSKIFYDAQKIFINHSVDALNNESISEGFNYRTMQPYLLRDANDNRTGVRFDEMGWVAASFIMGMAGEFKGDLLDTSQAESSPNDHPTTKMEYEFRYFFSGGKLPDRVKTTVREQHHFKPKAPEAGSIVNWLSTLSDTINTDNPGVTTSVVWQDSYAYCDGSGNIVLRKVQAEPGFAPARDTGGELIRGIDGLVQMKNTAPQLRWVGNGRTLLNNKGKPVKQYDPYFDSSPEYNTESELVQMGFTTLNIYDAPGRVIKTIYPTGTFSSLAFDAWKQVTSDQNDHVKASDWYSARITGAMGAAEKLAAEKTSVHDQTPAINWIDSLGRPFIKMEHCRSQRSGEAVEEYFYYTRTEADAEGNSLSITDARGNKVMTWKYDMLGSI